MEDLKIRNKKLKKLIAKGKEGEVIEILFNSIPEQKSSLHEAIILLSNQYNDIKNREALNLPFDPKEKSRIVYSTLKILEKIENNEHNFVYDFNTESVRAKRKKVSKIIIITIPTGIITYLLITGVITMFGFIIFLLVLIASIFILPVIANTE